MKQNRKSSSSNHKLHFRKWHRRFGMIASIFLLNLAITGVLLNHYEGLKLHQSYITTGWLLDWYGVSLPKNVRCLESKSKSACQVGKQVYLDDAYWEDIQGSILFFGWWKEDVLLATSANVYWLTDDFKLIEVASFSGQVDGIVESIGVLDNQLLIKTSQDAHYRFDMMTYAWKPTEALTINNQSATPADKKTQSELGDKYRQRQITHLQFVQDLHSGSIIGLSGKITHDITAFIIIWLVASGFITWRRRKNKK
ncbi:PepSY domain-containing protein [Kangiella marina]|uniref:PepSY domain-containing protein n=1 Tax=Kangiella marina TaxID=1079178 RepID=A0ABP8IEC7_9GAMM